MARERKWVMELLARLTPAQRERYETEMRKTPSHYRSGKKHDGQKAACAERIMYEDALSSRKSEVP